MRALFERVYRGGTLKKSDKSAAKKQNRRQQPTTGLGRLLASPGRTGLLVFAVAFLVYANTIGHDFVWDDFDLIEGDPTIEQLDARTVGGMFLSNFWEGYQHAGYYRPLVTLSYHVQHRVFDGNPKGFHFANVAWNALVCVLIFVFVRLLFANSALGLITALVFALHPLHTENVAWVSGRTDLLSTLWAMAALVLYLQFRRRANPVLLPAALFAFLLSLFAKESSVFVPLVVVLMEIPPLRALTTRDAPRSPGWAAPAGIAGMFGVVVLYLILRNRALDAALTSYPGYADGVLAIVALPLSVFGGYVIKLLFPFALNAEWDAVVPVSLAGVEVWVGAVLLAAIVVAAIRFRHRAPVWLGAAVFVLGVGPVLNIIPIGEISAERFLYFPSLGFALVIGSIVAPSLNAMATDRPARRWLVWGLGVLLIAYAVRVTTRNPTWANEKVLFTATVEAAPESPRARVNLGDVAMREGRIADTIALYKQALEIDPDFTLALSNLAGVYVRQGQFAVAEPLIERAVEVEPENAGLLANLGALYVEQGKNAEAIPPLERAVKISPNHPIANFSLAKAYVAQRRAEDARPHFERVAHLGGAYHMADYYLAVIENGMGNVGKARQHAQRFIQTHGASDEFTSRARAILQGNR